jgi:signal transduction histidine kinase
LPNLQDKSNDRSVEGSGATPAQLYAQLADGLHAMAQPLTILRGAMCALTMQDSVEPANRRYLDMSTKQVDRLCDLMSGLQSLLHAGQSKVEFRSFDLIELIDPIVEQQRNAARESGVRIVWTRPERPIHALGDEHGVEQAFSAALKTALSAAKRDERVQVEIALRDGFVGLTLRNESFSKRNLGSFERFHLTVVEHMIRSQCGMYELIDHPLSISLKLRISPQAGREVTSDCLRLAV